MEPSCCVMKAYTATSMPSGLYNSRDPTLKSLEEVQDMIERLQQTQLLQAQRITDLERQLESHREGIAEFPFFSRLPPELRCQIWEMALPVQIFRPFRFLQPSFLEWTSVPPPVISRVCREARYVAQQNGALYCHDFLAPLSWAWFNGHTDILDLCPYNIVGNSFTSLQTKLLEETRTVLLDVNSVNSLSIKVLFGEESRLPNVHTIHLMAGNTFQAERQSWHPHAVARLFGSQSFAHVDIEDDDEVERLEQLLIEMTSASDGSFTDKWQMDAITKLRAQVRPPATVMEPWRKAKQHIMQGWMSYNVGASSLEVSRSCVEEDGMIKEDEVRKSYPQMPIIKLVQAFELAPAPKLAKWYKDHGRQIIEDYQYHTYNAISDMSSLLNDLLLEHHRRRSLCFSHLFSHLPNAIDNHLTQSRGYSPSPCVLLLTFNEPDSSCFESVYQRLSSG
ncbi:uncharacterized protein TRIVIDRAFT_209235 [Trichoderma virens Gv29-8]|uniref:2EXR domain-containing protein n=1 Tax=Hypocrea virens (strain Gv29-8 / FGSC 10586) TaxID=413071 RepID=G9MRG3_HYPVG|nr:uncharacterized protein TRIVIDRAFT_209235 [Trichoderma virens Gv29-8]EHK22685.1 hypothetical protein TRIVIDRAFT_209235 [Trichoderma virens Gv29-8]